MGQLRELAKEGCWGSGMSATLGFRVWVVIAVVRSRSKAIKQASV